MTDHTNTYPDLVNVEDWLNAKGYTGEAGACHQAMSLIRKQDKRIAELEEVDELNRKAIQINADVFADGMKKLMALCDAKDARIAVLEAENARLRRAVSDLTLDKQILREAAKGNF